MFPSTTLPTKKPTLLTAEEVKAKRTEVFYKDRFVELDKQIREQKKSYSKKKFYVQDYFLLCAGDAHCENCDARICACHHERCIYPFRAFSAADVCRTCFYARLLHTTEFTRYFCEECCSVPLCQHDQTEDVLLTL